VGRNSTGRPGNTLEQLAYTLIGSPRDPHPKVGKDQGTRIVKSTFSATHPRGSMGLCFTSGQPTRRKTWCGSHAARTCWLFEENHPPKTGAYSGIDCSKLATLLLQRNWTRHLGNNIVVGLNSGLRMIPTVGRLSLLTALLKYRSTLSRGRQPGRSPVTRGHNRGLKAATKLVERPLVAVTGSVSLAKSAKPNAAPIAR